MLGAGERPLLIAEKTAFEHRIGKRGAVERHKRRGAAARLVVHGAGQMLFAGAAFAAHQHGHPVGMGHLPAAVIDRLQTWQG